MNARKKVLMGMEYTIPVKLEQYGGEIFRVHAVSDFDMTAIEEKTGYSLAQALEAMTNTGLSADEMAQLRERKEKGKKDKTPPSPALTKKLMSMMNPQMKQFLIELIKAGIAPADPDKDCPICHGGLAEEICQCRDMRSVVDKLKGFSILELGETVIEASTVDWTEVESFFSRKKAGSGVESSV